MIEGTVNASYEAVILLTVHGPTGRSRQIEAVLDTGFTEFLALSSEVATELSLPFFEPDILALADGREETFEVCGAVVDWDGRMVEIPAHVSDGDALIGMRMLVGYNVNMDVEVGGRVTIRAKGDEGLG